MRCNFRFAGAGVSFSAILLAMMIACGAFAEEKKIDEEINVALSKWGATASASSEYSYNHVAENVLDGRWTSSESDKWNSVAGDAKPHWLMIDLGQSRPINKVVIYHEGVVSEGEIYDTADFVLQRASSPEGPWMNLTDPVVANTEDVTTHEFDLTETRYLRLWITQGEQYGNEHARIYEIQAYSPADALTTPLVEVKRTPAIGASPDRLIHIIQSSHEDIAWMDSPQQCIENRDRHIVTPVLDRMKDDKDFKYNFEDTLILMEYLDRHPERKEEIHQFTLEGRLDWGALYNQPYEDVLTGEQLIREVYFGRKWFKKTFPGCDARVAWNVDVPGRPLQAQQILAKSGIQYLMISRHEEGMYQWYSPDGSSVLAYSPGHYGDHLRWFRGDTAEDAETIADIIRKKDRLYKNFHETQSPQAPHPVLISSDAMGAADYTPLIKSWNELPAEISAGKLVPSNSFLFFEDYMDNQPQPKKITGTRPNIWLYIMGPSHYQAVTAKRAAGRLLPAAETFSVVDGLLSGTLSDYPAAELDTAWRASIYPDHGWGGNKGHITDRVFQESLEKARDMAETILDKSLTVIAGRIQHEKKNPVTVFNDLSWKRTGPVTIELADAAICIIDGAGAAVPHQIKPVNPGSGRIAVTFIAEDVPSLGYKTYYVEKGDPTLGRAQTAQKETHENEFYKITLGQGGLRGIYDKQLQREILQTKKYLGAEVFFGESVGNGAGEFADIQQPSMREFEKVSQHTPAFTDFRSGPVFTSFRLEQNLGHAVIQQEFVVYNTIKRIDCHVSIIDWDGTKNREFRMAIPVDMKQGKVTYEVPMGVVTVGEDEIEGAAGWRHTTPCALVHPREVQNFISVNDDDFGVTMSSCVSVFDWIDPTAPMASYPVLQPILLASRRSCHWVGNWYLQPGDHHYSFSILSHKSGWENGRKFGIEANYPFHTIIGAPKHANANLPLEKSFASVSQDNVMISTIKKCEDDNSIIARLYDIEGKDSNVELTTFFDIKRAEHTNMIEEEGQTIPASGKTLKTKIGHHAIETFKLLPENK